MKRCLAVTALLAMLLTSCSATLVLRATAPTQDDNGTDCAAPVLVPSAGGLVRMHFYWTGPVTGQDSVTVAPGTPVTITKQVPAGLYSCTATAADSLGNTSCVSATLTKLVRGKFAKVSDLR